MTARVVWAAVCAAAVAACDAQTHPDNAAALADIQSGKSGDEVVVQGIVSHVGRTTGGESGTHEHFDVRISSGAAEQDILVADNVSIGAAAPVRTGDTVIVKGVLEVDPTGPVIHWTHHDPANRHVAGFVLLDGKMYD